MVALAQQVSFDMTSFKRKMRRRASVKLAKYLKKNMGSIIEEKVKSRLSGLGKIPDSCDLCTKYFDKTDREQVFSWMLRVNEEDEKYNLFCPECYEQQFPDQKAEGGSDT